MVDGETIRGYLNEQIKANDLLGLEQQVNQALVVGLPRRLWKARIEVAIDLHDEPFYGHRADLLAYTCRGEATKGTTHFFRLATAYVIFKDMRLTLALLFAKPGDTLPDIVAALLRRLHRLGFKVRRLYLDKGFCSIPILRYLTEQKWPAILACPIRGKRGGTRALCQGHRSYLTKHTFKSQPHGIYTVPVAVVRTFTSHKRRKHGSRRVQWLVFVLLNSQVSARLARKLYAPGPGLDHLPQCRFTLLPFELGFSPGQSLGRTALAFLSNQMSRSASIGSQPFPATANGWLSQSSYRTSLCGCLFYCR